MNTAYIVIGPYVWGKGKTAQEAHTKAQREYGRKLKDYDTFEVHPDTDVTGMGGMSWPAGAAAPKQVARVRKGKSEAVTNG